MKKSTGNQAVVINGKIVVVAKEKAERVAVQNEIINGITIPKAVRYSEAAHAAASKKMKKGIYSFVPVQLEILLKVENNNGVPVVSGVGRRVAGTNSPNARALMQAAGEMNTDKPLTHLICSIKDNDFVEGYTIATNEKDSKYYESNSIVTVNFRGLADSIDKAFKKKNPAEKAEIRELIISQVTDMGLEITLNESGATAQLATQESTGLIANMIYWSPSNQRSETATFTTLEPKKAFSVLDRVSGYALSNAMKGEKTLANLVKLSARIGILSAPSIELPKLGNDTHGVMLFIGNEQRPYIEGPYDYDAKNEAILDAANIEIDNNTNDGAIVQSMEYTKECALLLGMKITDAQALMFAMQTRMSVLFTKVFGETKTRYNMNKRRDLLLNSVDESKVLRVAAGEDVAGKNLSDYEIVIIGNADKLGMIVDLNGAKLAKNIDLATIAQGNFDNYLLDIAKATDTKLSGQAIQKFMGIAGITKIAEGMLKRDLNNNMLNWLEGDIDPVNCDLASFIMRYAEGGTNNTAAVGSMLETQVKMADSKIKGMSLEIESKFLRALFDDTFFLTNKKSKFTLGANKYTGRLEAFNIDVELMFADRIEAIYADSKIVNKDEEIAKLLTGVAVKFPSPSADENALFTFVTRRQMAERIAHSELSKEDKAILLDDFLNTSYGTIKIAPSNTLKHRLAGMDTDYDGLAVFFEKELVDGLLEKYPVVDGKSTFIGL